MATQASVPAPQRKGGFGAWLVRILGALPYTVSGIEQIHGDAISGADKKKLAMESLGLAIETTGEVDPALDPALIAASQLVSLAIDGVKKVYNEVKKPKPATAVGDPAPVVPTPAPAPAAE